jgi:hypothetical protein
MQDNLLYKKRNEKVLRVLLRDDSSGGDLFLLRDHRDGVTLQ